MSEHDRSKSHMERPLRFFRSPLNQHTQGATTSSSTSDLEQHVHKEASQVTAVPHFAREENHVPQNHPPFHRHSEATPSELFYDLFFVANLATFTTQNEVNSVKGLANYIGFFCILWFTWCQVGLFDVRLSRDSVFDRICKVGQFGVMIGFSFISYYFDPAGAKSTDGSSTGYVDGKSLSIILMASRFILFFQYLSAMWWLRNYRETRIPLTIISVSCLVSAFIYLGISFTFDTDGSKKLDSKAYIAWYVVSIVETLLNLVVSSTWRSMSFKGTHVVERFSLLTLIVLGEGILGLSKAIITVWGNTYYYPGLGAAVMSVIILIYSLYQLYFDTIAEEHFGTIRQQIWAFLHFPLHLGIVLFDEGSKQFVLWNTAIKQQEDFTNFILPVPIFNDAINNPSIEFTGDRNTTDYFMEQANLLSEAYTNFIGSNLGLNVPEKTNATALDEFLAKISKGVDLSGEDVLESVYGFWGTIVNGIFKNFKIAPPEKEQDPDKSKAELLLEKANAAFTLYDMVFAYFFAATGITVLLLLAMWLLSKKTRNTWYDYVRFGTWFLTGATISVLAVLDISAEKSAEPGFSFINGPWVLPTPMILLTFLVIIFHLPIAQKEH